MPEFVEVRTPQTFVEIMDIVTRFLPNATFGEDLEGQLMINTDFHELGTGELVPFMDWYEENNQ